MIINDPGYLFGIGLLLLICALRLISSARAHVHGHTYNQPPTGTGRWPFVFLKVPTLSIVVCTEGDKSNSFLWQRKLWHTRKKKKERREIEWWAKKMWLLRRHGCSHGGNEPAPTPTSMNMRSIFTVNKWCLFTGLTSGCGACEACYFYSVTIIRDWRKARIANVSYVSIC